MGGIQSSLGSGQGPRARGITTGYRNTAQPRSPTPAFLKTRQGIQNAHLRFTIALHPGYSKERVLAVANLPAVIHISTHQLGLGVSGAVGAASGLCGPALSVSAPTYLSL